MNIVEIHIVVGDDRNLFVASVVESLAQKCGVVGKSTVTDIFTGCNGNMVKVVLSGLQGFKSFADNDLGRETNIVMNILFAKVYSSFATYRKRNGSQALFCKYSRHNTAKCMRSIGN